MAVYLDFKIYFYVFFLGFFFIYLHVFGYGFFDTLLGIFCSDCAGMYIHYFGHFC